jgi:hypothetical protein
VLRIYEPKRERKKAGKNFIMRSFIIFALPNINRVKKSRRIRQPRHTAHMRQMKNGYRCVARKPEGKIPFGRPRHR